MKRSGIRTLINLIVGGLDIQVVFGGTQAWTDGKTINLPEDISEEQATEMLAYTWHEAFHITQTEFSVLDPKTSEVQKRLCNCLEDGRIEKAEESNYPGVPRLINHLIETLRDEGGTLFSSPESESAVSALLGYVLNWVRLEINAYSAIQYLPQWRARLALHIGEDLLSELEKMLSSRAPDLTCTADADHLAVAITKLVQSVVDISENTEPLPKTDLGDLGKKVVEQAAKKAARSAPKRGGKCTASVVVPPKGTSPTLSAEAKGMATALAGRLNGVLQAETDVTVRSPRSMGNRMSSRHLYRVGTGSSRVFLRKEVEMDVSAHCHLILDTSLSMRPQAERLRRAGVCVCKAIESVEGLSVSASTFPRDRADDLRVTLLKGSNELTESVAARFKAMDMGGGTYAWGAYKAIRPWILESDKALKVVVLLTDGELSSTCVSKFKKELSSSWRDGIVFGVLRFGDFRSGLESMMPVRELAQLNELPVRAADLLKDMVLEKLRARRKAS